MQASEDETVIFSWIVYRSRQERDRIVAKVMADPPAERTIPPRCRSDGKRMIYGGFETFLQL